MLSFENKDVEFKQEYVPEIRKEVVAFANADGGLLLVGVRSDGIVIGVDDPDEVMLRIANSLKDSIVPDVMPFVSIRAVEMEGKQVVEVGISTGTNRPYYMREKGLRPGGVYVRKGSSSQPMTDEGIREMIVQNCGKSYESGRSIRQELTFETLTIEMKRRNIEFGNAQMRTLKLIGEDGLYTNLAYLFSDQYDGMIKAALFQGVDKAIFRDRKEFSGSILKQLEEVYQFIDLNNKTKATFDGLDRTDTRDYPEDALREALLNSMVHRDYAVSEGNIINIYDDRIEFVSMGGLVPGLELESIFLGVSRSRNPELAAVLYRMRLIESYGTGIGKIQRLYMENREKPKFETAKGVFRVTLPNRNEEAEKVAQSVVAKAGVYRKTEKAALEKQKRLIVNYARENGKITRKEVEELIGAGTTKAFRLLKELCEEGKLEVRGNGRLSKYVAKRK